jgi:hypothetical protein
LQPKGATAAAARSLIRISLKQPGLQPARTNVTESVGTTTKLETIAPVNSGALVFNH